MNELIAYVSAHFTEIVSAITAVVFSARAIVKLTPTPKDDTVLEKVVTFLKHVGLHVDSKQ